MRKPQVLGSTPAAGRMLTGTRSRMGPYAAAGERRKKRAWVCDFLALGFVLGSSWSLAATARCERPRRKPSFSASAASAGERTSGRQNADRDARAHGAVLCAAAIRERRRGAEAHVDGVRLRGDVTRLEAFHAHHRVRHACRHQCPYVT